MCDITYKKTEMKKQQKGSTNLEEARAVLQRGGAARELMDTKLPAQ
jgi:hypothetical protein